MSAPPTSGSSVQLEVAKDAVVTDLAKILGPGGVKIGEGTVVHPACLINAKVGPIVIGRFNVIEEQVEILNESEEPLVVGDYNLFEVGAKVQGNVGDANVLECQAVVRLGCSVSNGCTLCVGASLLDSEVLQDETVVVGPPGMRHREEDAKETHKQAILKVIDVLKESLPRCHHLRKPTQKS
eukprot:TRINITY_DN31861_c0_g1_i1.p1 TRINITY_DN31861_c0_g1~~TRINITY_DN31861_c0_g1_i1.p1  ORF type:complete len:182 (-),score=41.00 TRINITY_DN31861_c0_g1_i1:53-598(-)